MTVEGAYDWAQRSRRRRRRCPPARSGSRPPDDEALDQRHAGGEPVHPVSRSSSTSSTGRSPVSAAAGGNGQLQAPAAGGAQMTEVTGDLHLGAVTAGEQTGARLRDRLDGGASALVTELLDRGATVSRGPPRRSTLPASTSRPGPRWSTRATLGGSTWPPSAAGAKPRSPASTPTRSPASRSTKPKIALYTPATTSRRNPFTGTGTGHCNSENGLLRNDVHALGDDAGSRVRC